MTAEGSRVYFVRDRFTSGYFPGKTGQKYTELLYVRCVLMNKGLNEIHLLEAEHSE